jgi:hypothetical protein
MVKNLLRRAADLMGGNVPAETKARDERAITRDEEQSRKCDAFCQVIEGASQRIKQTLETIKVPDT